MENKIIKLNQNGRSRKEILAELKKFNKTDADWSQGKTFSLVYHAGEEHTDFIKEAYNIYFHHNGLNPGAFPSLQKFEAEVLSQVIDLFHGYEDTQNPAAGTMTSGGSESIMMAIKTYRDYYRTHRPEIIQPEMIVPQTIHPAFDKAAVYFNVKMLKAPVDQNFQVDIEQVKKMINKNTILLVGSAPQYPQGIMDPIQTLADLALENKISLHVDACLGGFFIPFAKLAGFEIPEFDFKIKGVTSISADLHKYGFTAKGASVILYRNKDLRRFQFFVSKDWPGGLFGSPSMTGTRPGGSIAAAWATLQAYGIEGYTQVAQEVMTTTMKLQEGIKQIGYTILGKPVIGVYAFTHQSLDVYAVADQMSLRGWYLDRQQYPAALHMMITPAHTKVADQFLKDLKESTDFVLAHPETSNQGMAAMYGMAAKAPDPSMIDMFLYQFMDERYDVKSSL